MAAAEVLRIVTSNWAPVPHSPVLAYVIAQAEPPGAEGVADGLVVVVPIFSVMIGASLVAIAACPRSLGCTLSLRPSAGTQPSVVTKYALRSPAAVTACTAAWVCAAYRLVKVCRARIAARGYLLRMSRSSWV